MKQGICICIFGSLAIGCLATSPPLLAQIVPDATLPVNSIVTPQGNTLNITGGTSAGANLFHSFREFSLPAGSTAHFNNSINIQNIITRVTGGSISNIDGVIKANGTANLFLINPTGIVFGPNASLNIGGSFLASTASSIKLADGNEFSATNPAAPPLLTVNVPVGLQLGQNPGGIVVRGAGHNLSVDPETRGLIRSNRPAGLQVSAGQTLALVGGDISLVGGNITAEEGRITLMSAGAMSYVSLTPNSAGWALDYSGVGNLQDIQLSGAASADVSGSGSGTIEVRGRRVTLSEGSVILGQTEGGNSGGTLSVRAAESVEIIGTTADRDFDFNSGLVSGVSRGATGSGGDLTVETGQLTLADGGQIIANTSGAGDAGTLTVRAAESVNVIGSYLSTSAQTNATGNGGDLMVETGRLSVRDGAQISAGTSGAGDAGTLTVRARESVAVIGTSISGPAPSGLFASTGRNATGRGGDVTVETGRLTVGDGARISASTSGAGDAGTLTVRAAESVEVIGSALFANVNQGATGFGGDVTVETGRLTLRDGGQIASATSGAGDAGTVTVRAAESVDLIGTTRSGQAVSTLSASAQPNSTGRGGNLTVETGRLTLSDGAQISASISGAGDGGALTVKTGRLTLSDGAQISASTSGAGDGGTLTVLAAESVELIGSDLSANVSEGATGKGGDLRVETGRLSVRDGGQIGAGTFGAGDAGTLTVRAAESVEVIGTSSSGVRSGLFASTTPNSTGNGGNLTVETGRLTLRDGATINASTYGAGNAGTLTVRAAESVDLIGSALFANVYPGATGAGGNLRVETGRLTLRDGAQIGTATFGPGNAGTLTVLATGSVELIGTSADGLHLTSLSVSTQPDSTGNGGNLTVETGRLTLADGAEISALTSGDGNAGTLTVRARESVDLIGMALSGHPSGLFTSTEPNSTGRGGDLRVETGRLTLRDGAEISASTSGAGDAGKLAVRAAESVELIASDLSANVNEGATGFGGDLTVETGRLTLRDLATISAITSGAGNGGTLTVRAAESVEAIDSNLEVSVYPGATGKGGNLTVETGRLTVRDGAQISAGTFSAGDAGRLTVRARESVELIGTSSSGRAPSGLFASAASASTGDGANLKAGSGGDLRIETGRLTVRDGATVSARSTSTGAAGNLDITASAIRLDNQASVIADTSAGGGNITLNTGSIQLRRNSGITTNATGNSSGGNITFNTDTIAALENSDISANSQESFGGKVTINATGIFGTQYRLAPTSNSDITATGGSPQLNGVVTINTPDADPTSGLIALPSQLRDVTGLINNPCTPLARGSSFTVTGRGGIPQSPTDPLTGTALAVDWISPPTAAPALTQEIPKSPNPGSPPPLVEAQGWVISPQGTVTLTANPPTGTPHSFWQVPANCPAIQ